MKMPGDARWTVLGLLFLGGMINYLDRSAIRHNQGSMLSWHRPASRPASRATVHGL